MVLHVCDICDRIFDHHTNYLKHMKTHNKKDLNTSYRCKLCDKSFANKYNLDRHRELNCKHIINYVLDDYLKHIQSFSKRIKNKNIIDNMLASINCDRNNFFYKFEQNITRDCHLSEYELYGNYVYKNFTDFYFMNCI